MKPVAYEIPREVATADRIVADRVFRGRIETTPHEIAVDWSPLPPGVTDVDVVTASMSIAGAGSTESVPAVQVSPGDGGTFVVTLPAGVRASVLTLSDLTIGSGDAKVSLASQADLAAHDPPLRLTVALPDPRGGFGAPTFAVPAVGGRSGVTPASLTGASFEGRVLTLPEPAAPRLRIALVTGDPGDFSAAGEVGLSKVSAVVTRYPKALSFTAGNTTLWEFPQELLPGAGSQAVDFKPGLKKVLLDAVTQGKPPVATLTLDAATSASARLAGPRISGALVRRVPGTIRTVVEGARTSLALIPPGEVPLALDGSAAIVAGLTVKYDGMRLVPELSDPVPSGASGGLIVGQEGARVTLPPDAEVLRRLRLARVGLIGRAPEACELSVRLVAPMSGDPILEQPVVVQLEPSRVVSVVWFAIDSRVAAQPLAVAARATRGRFFWAANADGRPLVQVAVEDPDPPDRTVRLGGRVVSSAFEPSHRDAVSLTAAFASTTTPSFDSTIFVTIDLSDVTVRYAR
ncbi:MAG: hypothetical protein U0Q55_07605 [Vicinamibacterales bacterium]